MDNTREKLVTHLNRQRINDCWRQGPRVGFVTSFLSSQNFGWFTNQADIMPDLIHSQYCTRFCVHQSYRRPMPISNPLSLWLDILSLLPILDVGLFIIGNRHKLRLADQKNTRQQLDHPRPQKHRKMREEVAAAVVFITRLVKRNECLSADKIAFFSERLSGILIARFENHWYQDKPQKGQAYRCIRVNESMSPDPVLEKAAADSGLTYEDLKMPPELTLWIDPHEVCCR